MNAKNIKKFIYYLLEVNVLVAVFRDAIIIYPKSVKLNSIYLLLFFFFIFKSKKNLFNKKQKSLFMQLIF